MPRLYSLLRKFPQKREKSMELQTVAFLSQNCFTLEPLSEKNYFRDRKTQFPCGANVEMPSCPASESFAYLHDAVPMLTAADLYSKLKVGLPSLELAVVHGNIKSW
ncbi:hypothetical protein XENOCAPTIV_009980 [Xenoophorus captivus]|uniref:Uncharacterized protein n=1 Tax=Xenoophorus captivus TaxID=1517983 RepID=A0ABV0Q4T3_9TELE